MAFASAGPMGDFYQQNPYYQLPIKPPTQEEATAAAHGVPIPHHDPEYAGSPLQRIMGHYGYMQTTAVDQSTVVDLSSKEGSLKAMSMLTQEGTDMTGDDSGLERCGTTSLLAAAMYGGTGGVTNLINSIEAYAKRLRPGSSANGTLEEIKKRIHDGKPLTMADMNAMSSEMYGFFKGAQKGKPGLLDETMTDFLKHSPDLAKEFKKDDLTFESIGGHHMVLGIGRSDDRNGLDKNDPGAHKMIFDPQSRVHKKFNESGEAVVDGRGSQIVTDSTELLDYHTATTKTIDEKGTRGANYSNTDWWKKTQDMYKAMYGGMY